MGLDVDLDFLRPPFRGVTPPSRKLFAYMACVAGWGTATFEQHAVQDVVSHVIYLPGRNRRNTNLRYELSRVLVEIVYPHRRAHYRIQNSWVIPLLGSGCNVKDALLMR